MGRHAAPITAGESSSRSWRYAFDRSVGWWRIAAAAAVYYLACWYANSRDWLLGAGAFLAAVVLVVTLLSVAWLVDRLTSKAADLWGDSRWYRVAERANDAWYSLTDDDDDDGD